MAGRKGRSGGRNAKTAAQHKLQGTYDASRHAHRRHPAPEVGRPKPPAPLHGPALKEWHRLTTLLKDSELLTVVDGAMLFQYCELHGSAQELKLELRKLATLSMRRATVGERLEKAKVRGRLLAQLRQYRQAIRMYLVEFGLSPAARSRVDLSAGGAGDSETGPGDQMSEFDTPPALRLVQ